MVRPWPIRVLQSLLHSAVMLWLPLVSLVCLAPLTSAGSALGIGVAAALLYGLSLWSARLRFLAQIASLAIALSSAAWTWAGSAPLPAPGQGLPAWIEQLVAGLASADEFLLQALRSPTVALLSALLALLLAVAVFSTALGAFAQRGLPQRLWFARFHPVWARRYRPNECAHPLIGAVAIHDDPLLREKLLWLELSPGANAFLFAPAGSAAADRVTLHGLEREVRVFCEGARWYQSGHFAGERQPARLRLFAQRLHPASPAADPVLRPAAPGPLPVRDFYAADNSVYGKTYREPQDVRLLGLLLDSRPNLAGPPPALPRFTALIERLGQVQAEYPHKDLLGQPFRDQASGRLHLPWRGPDEEVLDLELPLDADAVRAVNTGTDSYYLLWVPFAPEVEPLETRP
jgi:hypothetical protein